jgi:nucleoside-diphosphate-sugar epimerase
MAGFTIFGANGWIGSALARHLAGKGHHVRGATRNDWPAAGQKLDNVIYAIGLTADFRGRPMQTAQAHVEMLLRVLERYSFESFLYLSSTRVYRGAQATTENAALLVNPTDPDDVYNVTKLAGESICLSQVQPRVRVVRISNVIGLGDRSNNFLPSIVAEARTKGRVLIRTSPDSEKDYLGLDDLLPLVEIVALEGKERLYNLASGRNVKHGEIAALVEQALGAAVSFADGAPTVSFPPIAVDRIRSEFGFAPSPFEQVFDRIARDQ